MREWDQFLFSIEQELGSSIVNQWLRSLTVARFDAANLYLTAQDPLQITWFEEHIRPRLKKGFFNENYRPIQVHLTTPSSSPKKDSPPPIAFSSDAIDPDYTLAHFIVSPDNLMAYKLIQTSPFNPLFLYGPKGCGKTHLLMGAALEFAKEKKRAFYVHANTFTNHVVQAIRMGQMPEFRNIYRNIDLLLIDDVDRLGNRDATQEEFFHTFNTLHTLGKPIILSSTSPPAKLTNIEARLISRFEWGIAVGMGKIQMREILLAKAKLWNFFLPEKLGDYLLLKFPSDPILALQALALRFQGNATPTIEAAEKILADLLQRESDKAVTPEKIVKTLSDHFGVKPEDLLGKSQMREYALPRQVAMYLCREALKMPFQAIGKFFGRDHSTVMSSVKQIQKEMDGKNREIQEAVDSLKA
ncbi:MAG TPA: DnaA/Hda family protein [Chlamydiales bacterium]|jgi:chromosomal replication initiator protein|nr:DnaA/Hda family protein [Chlamydiales bacterium]